MAFERVRPDVPTWLIEDRLSILIGRDDLMDSDYRPLIGFGIDPDVGGGRQRLEVVTRSPTRATPAGWRLEFFFDRRLYLPALEDRLQQRCTTEQFRRPTEEDR